MNWLLLVVLVVLIGNVLWGYKRGFMRVVLSLVSWVIVILAVNIVTPVVAGVIVEVTPVESIVHDAVNDKLQAALGELANDVTESEKVAALEEKIPEQLRDMILGEDGQLDQLVTAGAENVDVDTTKIAFAAAYLIGLIVVLIVTRIALAIVDGVLGLASKLPLIGQADALLGIFAGAAKGVIYVWVAMTVIALLTFTGANTELIALVNESELLGWFYDNNLILGALAGVMPK